MATQDGTILVVQLGLIQAAVGALFETSPDKSMLRQSFQALSEQALDKMLQLAISEDALDAGRQLQASMLQLLK